MNHHAFLYISSSLTTAGLPEAVLTAGADVEHIIVPTLGIDQARALTQQAHTKPIAGSKRSFLIQCASATVEAQNALLKLLEEPPVTAEFYIVVPNREVLIPTVRSRLFEQSTSTAIQANDTWSLFMQGSLSERIALIADKTKAKDQEWFAAIYQGVLHHGSYSTSTQRQTLDLFVRNFNRRGASRKMLLEHIALVL